MNIQERAFNAAATAAMVLAVIYLARQFAPTRTLVDAALGKTP